MFILANALELFECFSISSYCLSLVWLIGRYLQRRHYLLPKITRYLSIKQDLDLARVYGINSINVIRHYRNQRSIIRAAIAVLLGQAELLIIAIFSNSGWNWETSAPNKEPIFWLYTILLCLLIITFFLIKKLKNIHLTTARIIQFINCINSQGC